MGPLVGETELTEALLQAGKDLLRPYYSTDSIFDLLNKVESLLLAVEQDPIAEVRNALKPSMQALVSADLLRHPDSDVRVYVVFCLTEIMRITAPEAPYNDDQMKEVFEVTVEAFGKLADASCESYKKAEAVLDTVAKVRSSLVMLDLECDELILEMFRQFLKIIRLSPDCPQTVLVSMETIMVTVIDESEEVSMDLLAILLGPVRKESLDVSPVASRLVEKVLISCASKLRPDIMDALKSTGTSLDMYSPVVSSICQSGAATTEAQIIVNPTETEAEGKISEEQVVPDDSLQEKLDLGLSPKGIRSKRTARGGARAIGDDNVKNGDGLKQVLKQGQSESTEGETESGSTRRRRKPNSLLNPEEGYSFKTSSSIKKVHEKELGAAKKASLPTKVGQTNQSVVISLSPSSKARKGSRKRSRSKMEETDLDAGSVATPASKKQIVKKDEPEEKEDIMETSLEKPEDSTKTAKSSKKEKAQKGSASKKQIVKKDDAEEEEDFMETDLEKPEESTKTAKSSKKEREEKGSTKSTAKKPLAESKKEKAQKGSAKTAAKKPPAESKKEIGENGLAKTSAKKPLEKSVHSDAKKKNSEGASMESSKSKKKNSRAMTPPTKESEQTLKSHPKRKRTAREEVESNKSEHGEELVGKSVKVWWPLDKKFYDGVIKSYSSLNKKHQVLYSDGDSEELNLKKERWEIISEQEKEETDLPDSTPLSDIMRRNKAKKRKTESMHVQLKSSSEVRSSKKKDLVTSSTKQGKATKDAVKGGSDEPERREEINLQFPKDCVDKEESETKRLPKESNAEAKSDGEELKSANKLTAETGNDGEEQEVEKEATAEPQTDGEERESVKVLNEAKSDGEELKTANKATAESKIEGEEQGVEKEATAEPQTNGEERESVKVPNEAKSDGEAKSNGEELKSANKSTAESETEGEEQGVEKEATAEPETDGGEGESVKEPNEEAETEVQVRDSAKEPTADTNLIEEGRSEEKETGKVENVTEEEEQKIVKELEEDTDKAEGGTIPVSG
ncbi:sister chromatid cohesion protein PDS5 homolog E-like isoform X1 [Brassica napus]|uniref:sister chromatid cohesion protein PDS5 homolog E-like isoform X1 n=1 Tax=Brassica napus TaxID=3708 RepID=UPI00207873C6|nr:sister chromatid cohesion protein PDS5 homolog E-like isoform X1 [Brassica napus]